MSQFAKEHKTYFESAAGKEFLTYIHNQLDTEHEKAEKAETLDISYGHTKTAKAYRDIEEYVNALQAGSKKPR